MKTLLPSWLSVGVLALCSSALVWTTSQALLPTQEASPTHLPTLYGLGEYLLRSGQPEAAISAFKRGIHAEPASPGALAGLANSLVAANRIDEALTAYQNALAVDASFPEAHTNLGSVLLSRGQQRQACDHFKQALAREPNEISALNNLAWVLSTSMDASIRDGKLAVTHAEHAVAQTTGISRVMLTTLAAAYAEAGQFEQAITTINRAITHAQENGAPAAATELQAHLDAYTRHLPIRVK